VALTVASDLRVLGVLLAVAGLSVSPMITSQFDNVAEVSPPDRHPEAFTWVNTMNSAGSAGGAAVAGILAHDGSVAGYVLASAMVFGAAGVAFLLV
jgi:predicted MFS family arabinose efflux permease